MTNGEKIQTILDIDKDCTEVYGKKGMMTFSVPQDWWNAEYKEPKTGHWISTETKGVRSAFWCRYKCSLCGGLSDCTNYCPNCGAKMVEPQESEDKE